MIGVASKLSVNSSCYWPSEALHPCIVMVTSRIDSSQVAGSGAGIICGENDVAQILCGTETGDAWARRLSLVGTSPQWWSLMRLSLHRSFEIIYNTFFFFDILIFPIRGTEAGSWIVYRSKEAACSDTRQSVSGNMSDQASAASRLTKACQEENIASFLQAELSVQFLKIWASNIERVKPDLAHRGCKSQLLGSNLQTPCSRGGISSAFVISSQLGKALPLHGR